jgi:hypothetical protein
MKEYLKIKLLSLQAEARIIRQYENKRKISAGRARELLDTHSAIEFHKKEIFRLQNVKYNPHVHDFHSKVAYHEMKLEWLQRQANKTQYAQQNLDYNEKVYLGLHTHRVLDVRKEARATNLAYGFLQGHAYKDVEKTAYTKPPWDRIESMVMRYGEDNDVSARKARFDTWKAEAVV